MKILHCIPSLVIGGAQRQLSYLAPALANRGHEVHVAYQTDGPNRERLKSGRVILHQLQGAGNHDPLIFLQLAKLVFRLNPDIMQSWLLQMDILAGIAARLAGVPWVISERSVGSTYPGMLKNGLRHRLASGARAVISNSMGGDAFWAGKAKTLRRFVVPNGLPLDEIDRISPDPLASMGISPSDTVVLFAGRFEKSKNIETLLAALSIVSKSSPMKAVLCGDGPVRGTIERAVIEEGLSDSVSLPGFCANVAAQMKRADVFVFLSEFEGFPNVVAEAMACGCPLVVSDIPAHRELLDERCAILVDPHDPGKVAAAIRGAIERPAEAKNRALVAKGRVARWSVESMVLRYDEIYRDLLTERETSR